MHYQQQYMVIFPEAQQGCPDHQIVLQVEEAFGVIVLRDDAFQVKTLGDLPITG